MDAFGFKTYCKGCGKEIKRNRRAFSFTDAGAWKDQYHVSCAKKSKERNWMISVSRL